MKNEKKKNSLKKEEKDLMENFTPASSARDCTGLIPANADPSEEEFENYREILPFAVPKMPDEDDREEMRDAERLNRF
ncbi:MAG: hypothetical protein NC084_08310 [Bacteroides sp.]|nr:hypothetical protein [Eubacterium sp.]MCM1418645.1 hypothetical protein [Roseburia sp.]MCM1462699.1 hypothetical protein [Bacteroides sp.]